VCKVLLESIIKLLRVSIAFFLSSLMSRRSASTYRSTSTSLGHVEESFASATLLVNDLAVVEPADNDLEQDRRDILKFDDASLALLKGPGECFGEVRKFFAEQCLVSHKFRFFRTDQDSSHPHVEEKPGEKSVW
jgi:hypothetical protein